MESAFMVCHGTSGSHVCFVRPFLCLLSRGKRTSPQKQQNGGRSVNSFIFSLSCISLHLDFFRVNTGITTVENVVVDMKSHLRARQGGAGERKHDPDYFRTL
jgi:hypothetical protein